MNDDELRSRLARLDPQATAPVDPLTSPRAQDLLERTMTTTATTPQTPADRRTRRTLVLSSAAAVAVVALTVGVLSAQGGDGPATTGKKTTLTLALPDPNAMSSCLMFDVAVLKGFPVAFAGTVTAVAGDTVSLEVTHWYAGGSAQVVTLTNPAGTTSASLEGVTFVAGEDYLVSATDGNVNGCGFSGPADPTLEKAYAEAFAS